MNETPQQAARRLAAKAISDGFKPEALHEYKDAGGKIVFYRIRCKRAIDGDKWIRPMYLNGASYELGELDFPQGKPLYCLPDLLARPDDDVWWVEGEPCADGLARILHQKKGKTPLVLYNSVI